MAADVKQILERNKELVEKKSTWLEILQLVGEYVHQLKQDFMGNQVDGSMLNKNVFDSTAPKCNRKAASAFVGMLWQNGAKSIQINPPKELADSNEVKEYFDKVTDNIREDFDDPRAGLSISLEEFMNEDTCFGTSGVGIFPGADSTLLFESWGIGEIAIAEGEGGIVDTIHRTLCWPLKRIIQTYGADNLSPRLKQMAKESKELGQKIKILHAIEPRRIDRREVLTNLNMPFASCHIEVESQHLIRESGYEEMPVKVARFYKKAGEVYGRSMAMDALPDILEINAVKEARMLALEKKLDPPLGMYSDSISGNGKINTSAGGTTIVNPKARGKLGGPPIFQLYEIGDIREADKQIEDLKQSISEHFFNDRLLDFNNETEMTLGEAQMRQQIRGEGIGPIFLRLTNELFTPMIERGISICFRKGRMGVLRGSVEHRMAMATGEEPLLIPDSIANLIRQGKEFYEIKYFTPASRIMEAEQASGAIAAYDFASMVAKSTGNPEVFDGLDDDKALELVSRVRGAPAIIMKSVERREGIREMRRRILEQQQALQQAQQVADVAATAGDTEAA